MVYPSDGEMRDELEHGVVQYLSYICIIDEFDEFKYCLNIIRKSYLYLSYNLSTCFISILTYIVLPEVLRLCLASGDGGKMFGGANRLRV